MSLSIVLAAFSVQQRACGPATFANNTFIKDCGRLSTPNATDAAGCCAACAESETCETWIFQTPGPAPKEDWSCKLCKQDGAHSFARGTISGGRQPFPPAPPPPVPPPPPPVPPYTPGAPNFIMLLTDDQDLVLGSMTAMPYTRNTIIGEDGATNLTNFFTNTPICCPSRATLLSGRYNHNNKAATFASSGGGVSRDGMYNQREPNSQSSDRARAAC